MLTADTITDEQIRELRESVGDAALAGDRILRYDCKIALGELRSGPTGSSDAEIRACRARCAEILNARTKEQK